METTMNDTISRQAAIDAQEKIMMDCNPDHFVGHQKFIEYMDNAEIGSFGNWQIANGVNMGLTMARVAIKQLPPAAEVKPGKCVNDGTKHLFRICPECGYDAKFCPNCGAKMEGGAK